MPRGRVRALAGAHAASPALAVLYSLTDFLTKGNGFSSSEVIHQSRLKHKNTEVIWLRLRCVKRAELSSGR